MSDNTPRLRLAELASMQEANEVTWNETLVQLDAFVDLYLLGQFVNTPPGSPGDGDAYLIGGTPAGAWSGYAYKIAYSIDGAWRFYTPFNGLRAYVATSGAFIVYLSGTWTDWNSLISANEVSVASASTCDLGAAGSLFVQITGTIAITNFGTAANRLRFIRFAGSFTLTHNATSLILLGGASRTTAAGDVGIYTSDASGNWRERDYTRALSDPGDFATKSGVETLTNKTLSAPLGGGLLDLTGAAGGQVKFPAVQNSSSNANTLDDYEEGTFTPTYIASGGTLSGVAYSAQYGVYTKIGNAVALKAGMTLSNAGSGGSGGVRLAGLPFAAPSDNAPTIMPLFCGGATLDTNYTSFGASVASAANFITLQEYGSGQNAANLPVSGVSNTAIFRVSGVYFTST